MFPTKLTTHSQDHSYGHKSTLQSKFAFTTSELSRRSGELLGQISQGSLSLTYLLHLVMQCNARYIYIDIPNYLKPVVHSSVRPSVRLFVRSSARISFGPPEELERSPP